MSVPVLSVGVFLKLDGDLGPGGSRNVGNEMFDVKLILKILFFYLFFYLINSSVILTLKLITIIAIVAKQAFFGGFEYLIHLFYLQLQGFYNFFTIPNVIDKNSLFLEQFILVQDLSVNLAVVLRMPMLQKVQLLLQLEVVIDSEL